MRHLSEIVLLMSSITALGCQAAAAADPAFVVLGNNVRVPEFPAAADFIAGSDFGHGGIGEIRTHGFQIRNMSSTSLAPTPVTIVGANEADYTVRMEPARSIPAMQQTEFVIECRIQGTGLRTAECIIETDSVVTPTVRFRLSAVGSSNPFPVDAEHVLAFDQPLKVKCSDGQCFVSGTILASNLLVSHPFVFGSIDVYAGTTDFADFGNEFETITYKQRPMLAGKPAKFVKIKFRVPAPPGSFRVFARHFPSDAEPSLVNNLAHADYFVPIQ